VLHEMAHVCLDLGRPPRASFLVPRGADNWAPGLEAGSEGYCDALHQPVLLQSQLLTGCSRVTSVPLSFCANLGQNSKNSKVEVSLAQFSQFYAGLAEATLLLPSLSPSLSLSLRYPHRRLLPCPPSSSSFLQRLDRLFICQPCLICST